jgi:hypothetical protein
MGGDRDRQHLQSFLNDWRCPPDLRDAVIGASQRIYWDQVSALAFEDQRREVHPFPSPTPKSDLAKQTGSLALMDDLATSHRAAPEYAQVAPNRAAGIQYLQN